MSYVVDTPNIQLDAADISALTAAFSGPRTGNGFICNGPNINLDAHDIQALYAQVTGSKGAVNTENINLTAADVAAIATATGH